MSFHAGPGPPLFSTCTPLHPNNNSFTTTNMSTKYWDPETFLGFKYGTCMGCNDTGKQCPHPPLRKLKSEYPDASELDRISQIHPAILVIWPDRLYCCGIVEGQAMVMIQVGQRYYTKGTKSDDDQMFKQLDSLQELSRIEIP